MIDAGLTRRTALLGALSAALLGALSAALLGALSAAWPASARGRISVDVSPLRRQGDNADADAFARALPGYLAQSVGGRNVSVRIDSVTYGPPGSNGSISTGAVDWIEGVGIIDGRSVPLTCSQVVTDVMLPDVTGYGARMRQDNLARAFAEWLPRQAGF